MAIVENITADCGSGTLSRNLISRQWDDKGTLVQFSGYPEPSDDEQLIYRLIVWMKSTEDGDPAEQAPIELEADQWLISNVYTQFPQTIRFQLCITNEAGTYEKHSPIFSGNIGKSLSHSGEEADIDVSTLFDPYKRYVDELVVAAGAVVIDEDLDTAGAAADAKATGDAVAELNERLDQLDGGGLTGDVKAALLDVVAHIGAWSDSNGQAYYDALYTALYPPANLKSISAVYTQSGEVYDNQSLDSLKDGLIVTAQYDDGTSENVTTYTLSRVLSVGTSTVTVAYGGKTTTFTVTVTKAPILPLYEWDLTDSLTDKISGLVATTTATQGTTGLVFDTANTYCDFGAIYQSDRTYELDIAEIGEKVSGGSTPRRLFMADTDANTAYGGGSGLILRNTAWGAYSGSSWLTISNNTMSGIEYFNGKTLRVYVDTDMIWHMYAKVTGSDTEFTPIGETPSAMREYTNGHVYIGGNKDDAIANTRVTGLRVYEGEID